MTPTTRTFPRTTAEAFNDANSRALVVWSDGFEKVIPMSRGLGGGVFSFSDVIAQPVPEPATAALMLAGCLLAGAVARKRA